MKELHFDPVHNLMFNPLRPVHTARPLKLNSANRNIPKTTTESSRNCLLLCWLFSCLMFMVQVGIKPWGHQRFYHRLNIRISGPMERPNEAVLNYLFPYVTG